MGRLWKLIAMFIAVVVIGLITIGCDEGFDLIGEEGTDLTAEELNDLGLKELEDGEYNSAVKAFAMAIELDPMNVEYYDNRGLAYFANDSDEKALADFNKAISLNPEFGSAIRHRGWLYHSQSKFSLARDDYRDALKYYPDDPILLNNLAWILVYRLDDNYEEALSYARRAVELEPTEPGLQDTLALTYFKTGEYGKAIDHYTRAITMLEASGAIPEDDYYFYRRRGDAYLALGNIEEAREDYLIFIENGAPKSEIRKVEAILETIDE